RGELLVRLERPADARLAYDRAYDLATNAAEKHLLDGKRRSVADSVPATGKPSSGREGYQQ
ncbi:MAG: hypothetical protein QOD38_97, partial [Acidimicrobiaceae bacterium]